MEMGARGRIARRGASRRKWRWRRCFSAFSVETEREREKGAGVCPGRQRECVGVRCVIQERTERVGEEGQRNGRRGAEERAANGASSARGRRGVADAGWARGLARSNCARETKCHAHGLGRRDTADRSRAPGGFQTDDGLGPHVR